MLAAVQRHRTLDRDVFLQTMAESVLRALQCCQITPDSGSPTVMNVTSSQVGWGTGLAAGCRNKIVDWGVKHVAASKLLYISHQFNAFLPQL